MSVVLSSQRILRPSAFHVCSVGRYNSLADLIVFGNAVNYGGLGWPANNLAIYTPLNISERFTIARFMSVNGNATGTTDVGLYSGAGARLISTGNTARSSGVQYIGITDQSFPPGHYFLAMVCSSTGSSVFRTTLNSQYEARMCGMLQESLGSAVLPASMSPASYAQTDIYLYGFTQLDSL